MSQQTIRSATTRIIKTLYADGNQDKALLASLRGSTTLTSPRAEPVWPLLFSVLDDRWLSRTGEPTSAETAIFTALRLYAIHQQSNSASVYASSVPYEEAEGKTIFGFLATLRQNPDSRAALDRRVQQLLTTTNIGSLFNALTHLASIIKATDHGVKIDYPNLAEDLYWFQQSYEQANAVKLRWGQDYYRVNRLKVNSKEETN